MKYILASIFGFVMLASAALADDVTEVVEDAMQAYGDGDIKAAVSDLKFAIELLNHTNGLIE